jgi:uncharacterized protein (TIRG00374 family)
MRKLIRICVSVLLTAAIGYIFYRQVPNWNQAGRIMIQGRPVMIIAGLGFISLHIVLRAARWGVLLAHAKRGIAFRNLFSLTLVKYVVNLIPPRAGEVAASAVLARKENISVATVVAASVLERILDFVTVLFLVGVYLVLFSHRFVPETDRGREIILSIREYSIKGGIVIVAGFLVVSLLLRGHRSHSDHSRKWSKWIFHFLDGFRALESRRAVLKTIALSLAIWLSITMQIWCLVRAYLSDFPLTGSILLCAMAVVGISIPTPGGVGGYQFFMSLTLVNFFPRYLSAQDPYSQAAGISNGAYLVSMLPIILAGLIFLAREGLSPGRVARLAEKPTEHEAKGESHRYPFTGTPMTIPPPLDGEVQNDDLSN